MIDRTKEANELNRIYDRNCAEFVAIYGRRRVGKTYLVDETFSGRITFRHEALEIGNNRTGQLKRQLEHFYKSLILHGMEECEKPQNWFDAFSLLEIFLCC